MKRNMILIFAVCLAIGLLMVLSSCATATTGDTINRYDFSALYGRYNPLIPLEEQSILINLTPNSFGQGFLIKSINGLSISNITGNPGLVTNAITVLQPGKNKIRWDYFTQSATFTSETTTTAGNTIEFDFKPGQYYYFIGRVLGRGQGSLAEVQIDNINNVDNISVQISFDEYTSMSSKELIDVIHATIERGMNAFAARERHYNRVFDENIPFDQRAILVYPGAEIKVNQFSGKKVSWHDSSIKTTWTSGGIFDIVCASIPSGQHTFQFNGNFVGNQTMTMDFQTGKIYVLKLIVTVKDGYVVRPVFAHLIDLSTGQIVAEVKQ